MLNRLFSSEEGARIFESASRLVREKKMDKYLSAGVLVGLSGGADSVMLLCFLLRYREVNEHFPIVAVHINHGIRGAEADRDEAFAKALSDQLGVEFISRAFDVPSIAAEKGEGVEECARNIRYSEFENIISGRNDISTIAVAHNIDDNAETVIINMLRGAGCGGMAGIPPIRGNIVRPLLTSQKADIITALELAGVRYVTDSTNASVEYKRNFIRHRVLPEMKKIADSPAGMIWRLSENMRCDSDYINAAAEDFLASHAVIKNSDLAMLHRAVFVRVVTKMAEKAGGALSSRITDAIFSLLGSDNFSYSLSGAVFQCERGVCSVVKSKAAEENYFFEISKGITELSGYDADFYLSDKKYVKTYPNVYKFSIQADLSSAIINGRLYVRPKKDGDSVFYGGMTHKLKKLYNDRKIPKSKRPLIPVLCDDSGVLWVPGFGTRDDGNMGAPLFAALLIGKDEELQNLRMHSGSEYI